MPITDALATSEVADRVREAEPPALLCPSAIIAPFARLIEVERLLLSKPKSAQRA